jgi:hypothetical protein
MPKVDFHGNKEFGIGLEKQTRKFAMSIIKLSIFTSVGKNSKL